MKPASRFCKKKIKEYSYGIIRYLVVDIEPGEPVFMPCVVELDDGEGRVMVSRDHHDRESEDAC